MIKNSPIYFSAPVLEDALIQELRLRMSTQLDWLEYCFHKVERMSDNDGIEWAYFKLNDGSNREYKVAPDTNVGSMMFFEVSNSIHNLNVGDLSKYSISIVVWFNKSKISNVQEDVTQRYIKDVFDVLRKYFRYDENVQLIHNRDDVFNYEGLKTKELKPIIGKFGGFRINCEIYHDDKTCYNLENMSVSIPLADSGTFTNANLVGGILTITHKLNSTIIVSITINKANGEIITVMPNQIVSISQVTIDLGGIEAGTHTWTITAKSMLS